MTDNQEQETRAIREVEKHFLADTPDFGSDIKTYTAWPSFGGKLPEGEVLHKYAIVLPIPKNNEDLQSFYGLSFDQAMERLVKALWTDMDSIVKAKLFKGINEPEFAENVEPEAHAAAQAAANGWNYKPRSAGRKTTKVADVVSMLLAAGAITEEQAEGIETTDDLERIVKASMEG